MHASQLPGPSHTCSITDHSAGTSDLHSGLVFECVRKLAMVCMPVFFAEGSAEQLMFGLIVCFITAKSRGAHNRINGYVQKSMACSQALGTKHDRRLHILTLSVIAL